jgi:hypothetical protein
MKELEILRKIVCCLKYDKIGLAPFCCPGMGITGILTSVCCQVLAVTDNI